MPEQSMGCDGAGAKGFLALSDIYAPAYRRWEEGRARFMICL